MKSVQKMGERGLSFCLKKLYFSVYDRSFMQTKATRKRVLAIRNAGK